MNRLVMPLPYRLSFSIAAALSLTACQQSASAPSEPPPLEGATIGGAFTLTGEDKQPVSWNQFDGKYRIVYFGYTFCPDICPTDVQRAMAGLKGFEADNPTLGADIQPLFISIDPERDTPAVLREFTDNFHPRLIGMTGDQETLEQVAKDFGTTFSRGETSAGGGYLMNHYGYTYLFGRQGEPITMLPTDQGAEAVTAELEKWVR
ncbi:SCO family protein [Erythrobacter litoralis]|uniref:SCO family protein n=1 Tax=Erythrobacter litoralis TaxID=39960 RepID=UPI0024355BC9|nr:SCO family protein [Erythrobacter litoralis]MDG6078117.1 SCO family protein [Erythrobacter litoralis]